MLTPDLPCGHIVWPEGQPERARFARTWLGKQWLLVGPMGWRATLSGRRMSSFWPGLRGENYAQTASNMERAMDLHRQHFGTGDN